MRTTQSRTSLEAQRLLIMLSGGFNEKSEKFQKTESLLLVKGLLSKVYYCSLRIGIRIKFAAVGTEHLRHLNCGRFNQCVQRVIVFRCGRLAICYTFLIDFSSALLSCVWVFYIGNLFNSEPEQANRSS